MLRLEHLAHSHSDTSTDRICSGKKALFESLAYTFVRFLKGPQVGVLAVATLRRVAIQGGVRSHVRDPRPFEHNSPRPSHLHGLKDRSQRTCGSLKRAVRFFVCLHVDGCKAHTKAREKRLAHPFTCDLRDAKLGYDEGRGVPCTEDHARARSPCLDGLT